MPVKRIAKTLRDEDRDVWCNTIPDRCPICHKSIHPQYIYTSASLEIGRCQSVYRCTSIDCQSLFIASHKYHPTGFDGKPIYVLSSVLPIVQVDTQFPESIMSISDSFIEIYNQSMHAESQGMSQLVGIGLRKSIEFLIKDFALQQHPDKEEEIKSSMLGKCINDFITDTNVKECAKRAAWIGNDETHYVRKWNDRDISDLKLLVKLTVNWIDNVIMTSRYLKEMDSSHKK